MTSSHNRSPLVNPVGAVPASRMYVDEIGNSDYKASSNPRHRYLSLTGVILDSQYAATTFIPALNKLKETHFSAHHPDDPIVLHRREMLNGDPPFQELKDPARRAAFDADLLDLIGETEFRLITVVIDKLAMLQQYKVWQNDPYHYCMEVLLERYARDLTDAGRRGDVLAEARGKKEDKRLKAAYGRVYSHGTSFYGPEIFQALTSREIKLKTKNLNIAGLQLADLLAYPSFRATLAAHQRQALAADFNGRVMHVARPKYRSGPGGRVPGFGQKWLP